MKICVIVHKYDVPVDIPCCYPMGYMYISAVLKKAGHEVKVLNYNLWDYDLKQEIAGHDRVLFTGYEPFLSRIKKDAEICKEVGIKTIIGGGLATFLPDEMLQYCDTVIIGEGDISVLNALNETGKINGVKPKLSELPLPDYEGFGIEEYKKRQLMPHIGVLTSRGCPYSCIFCAHICNFQYRNLEDVFNEIDLYNQKYRIDSIIFNDNTLNLNKERYLEICEGMKQRKLAWSAAIRVDNFDEEMAKESKESGCKYFVVGVESLNQDKLDMMNKKITVEQTIKTLDLLHKYNIDYLGNLIVGFDGETRDDILNELKGIPNKYNLFPYFLQPFIGIKASAKHKLTPDEYNSFEQLFKDIVHKRGEYFCLDFKETIKEVTI